MTGASLGCLLTLFTASASAVAPASQFHLAVADGGRLSVSFRYDSPAPATCVYGPLRAPASMNATSHRIASYWNSTFHHHVLLAALGPSVAGSYSCAGGPTYNFTSPPAPGATGWSFVNFADWGYLGTEERGPSIPVGGLATNWSAVPVRTLLERLVVGGDPTLPPQPELVLLNGDIGYWDDSFGDNNGVDFFAFTQELITDAWFEWVQNVTATRPFMVTQGNHESVRDAVAPQWQGSSRDFIPPLQHLACPASPPSLSLGMP